MFQLLGIFLMSAVIKIEVFEFIFAVQRHRRKIVFTSSETVGKYKFRKVEIVASKN